MSTLDCCAECLLLVSLQTEPIDHRLLLLTDRAIYVCEFRLDVVVSMHLLVFSPNFLLCL